jgi:FkbM family methyltransferase
MTFISYAQNFEDVMLWRALRHVEGGRYIDVGAADPDEYSVTRAFYERGWQGINIEPTLSYFRRLAGARQRDLNLNVALGAEAGELPFFEVEGTGLSTLDARIADEHRATGRVVREIAVEVRTLAEIVREHVSDQVHFLKIDSEGAERAILEGADFRLFRPWIVLVEATRPLSVTQNFEEWEDLLTTADYHFAWFDGANRFYIAGEQWARLSPAFALPPNIFDDFIRVRDTEQLERIRGAESRASQAELRAAQAETQVMQADSRTIRAEARAAEADQQAARAGARTAAAVQEAARAEARAITAEQHAAQATNNAT